MQLVAPKTRALQEKYGNDKEKYGQEVMKLYQEEGVTPAASCLPLLLQMPVFLGLFYVLNGAATGLPKGHWFVTRPDLVDSLRESTIFGAKISATLSQNGFVIGPTLFVAVFLIITMTASLFFMQLMLMRKNMPPEALEGPFAQQQKMMLYVFPFMYLFMGVNIPVGVLLYWLTNNLWNFGQTLCQLRWFPAPGSEAGSARPNATMSGRTGTAPPPDCRLWKKSARRPRVRRPTCAASVKSRSPAAIADSARTCSSPSVDGTWERLRGMH